MRESRGPFDMIGPCDLPKLRIRFLVLGKSIVCVFSHVLYKTCGRISPSMIIPELPLITDETDELERASAYAPTDNTEPVKVLSEEEVAALHTSFDQELKKPKTFVELFDFLVSVQNREGMYGECGSVQRLAHTYRGILYGMKFLMSNPSMTYLIQGEDQIRQLIEEFFAKEKSSTPAEHVSILVNAVIHEDSQIRAVV